MPSQKIERLHYGTAGYSVFVVPISHKTMRPNVM